MKNVFLFSFLCFTFSIFAFELQKKEIRDNYFGIVDEKKGEDKYLIFSNTLEGAPRWKTLEFALNQTSSFASGNSSVCIILYLEEGKYWSSSRLENCCFKIFSYQNSHVSLAPNDGKQVSLRLGNCKAEFEGVRFENFSKNFLISEGGGSLTISNSILATNSLYQVGLIVDCLDFVNISKCSFFNNKHNIGIFSVKGSKTVVVENCRFESNEALTNSSNNPSYLAENCTRAIFSNNKVEKNGRNSFSPPKLFAFVKVEGLFIQSNQFVGNGASDFLFQVNDTSNCNVCKNSFLGNRIYSNSISSCFIFQNSPVIQVEENLFHGNNVSGCNHISGAFLIESSNLCAKFLNNNFTRNIVSPFKLALLASSSILVLPSEGAIVHLENNTFLSNTALKT